MLYVLASDPLAAWGQIAALVILVYMFVSIVVGLALALVLVLGLTWVRQKVELIKKVRPAVDSINATTEAAIKGTLPPPISQYAATGTTDKIVRTVAQIPVYAHTAEQKIDQGSDRVAEVVIEFRARTEMAKGVLKAFFLPGLTRRVPTAIEQTGIGIQSPGYRMLVEEKIPDEVSTEYGKGYTGGGTIRSSQLKDAPVDVVATIPKALQDIPVPTERQQDVRIS